MEFEDLLTAAQDAVVAALLPIRDLAGTGNLPAGLGVFQHVLEDTRPPMIVIGNITTTSDTDLEDEQLETVQLEVHSIYQGQSRRPLLAMMHAVRQTLHGRPLPAQPGIWFENPNFRKAEATTAWERDGNTYIGLSIFEFRAGPG